MRISVVQTRPLRGDIPGNIAAHRRLLDALLPHLPDVVVFPELSLTGYEPELARELAAAPDDARLEEFQHVSDMAHITIAVGLPTRFEPRPCISLVLFQPERERVLYSKRYLHADEDPFFVPAAPSTGVIESEPPLALAICYELSVPAHADAALRAGAGIYVASVAKTAAGVEAASARLAGLARTHGIAALMANSVGPAGGFECAGGTAAWNRRGEEVARLDGSREGFLVFDTVTGDALAGEA